MLSAVVEDLSRIPGVEVQSVLNREFFPNDSDPSFLRIDPAEEDTTFLELAGKADYTLVIAPEFENILAERCQWVTEVGGHLLGPSVSSIRLTGDKYALGQYLKSHGLPTPYCGLVNSTFLESISRHGRQISNIEQGITNAEVSGTSKFDIPCSTFEISSSPPWGKGEIEFPAVLKPRFGAGSLETFLVQGPEDWPGFRGEGRMKDMIVQRFVAGQAASVAILIGPKQKLALPAASQVLSADGRFHYLGGCIPLKEELTARAHRLACRAVESVPGLHGYVGVDLVLGSAPDGSEDWVIEINPRLTTSYIGLRALAESNLAQALIDIAVGKEVQPLTWRQGQVQFSSDGKVIRH